MKNKKRFTRRKLLFILIGATIFTYFLSLTNPFIWDDEQFIQKNVYVQTFDVGKIFTKNTVAGAGVSSDYYRPLTSLSFALDNKIWGLDTFGFHITNTLLHLAAGILLFFLLLQLAFPEAISFFVSLIFLLHPAQVEAVVYINSRGDSFYTSLLFGSLLLFAWSLRKTTRKAFAAKIASVILFALSILAKETAMVGIFLFGGILFLDILRQKTKPQQIFKRYLGEILTTGIMLAALIGYIVLRLTVLRFGDILNFYTQQNVYSQDLLIRLLTFTKILWIYIGILLFPFNLHMERTTSYVTSFLSPWPFLTILLIVCLIFLAVREIRKKKTFFIAISLSIFFLFLVPVSGIIPINGLLYEHWLYVPLIGFFLFFCSLGIVFLSKKFLKKHTRHLIYFGIVVCILYSYLSLNQILIWSNPITFYQYNLRFTQSARLYNNLGISYALVGEYTAAADVYKKALIITPTYAEIHNNLANIYKAEGKYGDAEQEYQRALILNNNFSTAFLNLIDLYMTEKYYKQALIMMEVNAGKPSLNTVPAFHFFMGEAFYKLGQFQKAENKFQQALQLSHNDPQILQAITAVEKGSAN